MLMKNAFRGGLLILLVALVLAGCSGKQPASNTSSSSGGGGGSQQSSQTSGSPQAQAQQAEGPKYTWRLAETHPVEHPTTKADKKFAELVHERSNGRITIDVFPSAALGEEKAVIEQVQLGAIEFTRVSSGPMAEFNSDFGVFSLPYIFDNDDHMWSFLRGEYGGKLLDSLQNSKLVGLAYYTAGARSFYARVPVKSLEDLKGMKIRVIQNKLNIEIMDALGASATPMAYGEVYSALQTGVIDAAENNFPSYLTSKHYEVAPYMILDAHQRIPEVLLMSKQVWDQLSPEDQDLIKQAAIDSIDYQLEEWAKSEKESEDEVRAAGAEITPVDDLKPWQEAVKPVIELYRDQYNDVLNAIAAARP